MFDNTDIELQGRYKNAGGNPSDYKFFLVF